MPKRIGKSIDGRDVGMTSGSNSSLLSRYGFVSGAEGGNQRHHGGPARVEIWDDFLGSSQVFSETTAPWASVDGSDAEAIDWTVTAGLGGTLVGTIGNTTATMAVSGIQLVSSLSWKANQGDLAFECRFKTDTTTLVALFIGFTDTIALEMPINSAGGAHTITTTATDAVGFLYDTADTTSDEWVLVGVANNTDATVQTSINRGVAVAPVIDTYAVFRVELSTTGVATFFYNGRQVGTAMTGAVTPTVALTPIVAGFNRDTTATPILTLDYVHASALRA